MKITEFFEDVLHAKLTNPIWSWGAIDSSNRVVLRVWKDQIRSEKGKETVEVFWKNPGRKSAGYNERERHLDAIRRGAQAFAVICTARKLPDGGREIVNFDSSVLLCLDGLFEDDRRIYARIASRIPLSEFTAETSLAEDLTDIIEQKVDATTKKALVEARIGQGTFRSGVLQLWNHRCCVTGSSTLIAIRASHIKPWRESTNRERLDPTNGFPLVASLDALFDGGLISFEDSGRMLISSALSPSERQIYGLSDKTLINKPSSQTTVYLEYHRKVVFRG